MYLELWKNYILVKRKWIFLVIALAVPVLVMCLLLSLRNTNSELPENCKAECPHDNMNLLDLICREPAKACSEQGTSISTMCIKPFDRHVYGEHPEFASEFSRIIQVIAEKTDILRKIHSEIRDPSYQEISNYEMDRLSEQKLKTSLLEDLKRINNFCTNKSSEQASPQESCKDWNYGEAKEYFLELHNNFDWDSTKEQIKHLNRTNQKQLQMNNRIYLEFVNTLKDWRVLNPLIDIFYSLSDLLNPLEIVWKSFSYTNWNSTEIINTWKKFFSHDKKSFSTVITDIKDSETNSSSWIKDYGLSVTRSFNPRYECIDEIIVENEFVNWTFLLQISDILLRDDEVNKTLLSNNVASCISLLMHQFGIKHKSAKLHTTPDVEECINVFKTAKESEKLRFLCQHLPSNLSDEKIAAIEETLRTFKPETVTVSICSIRDAIYNLWTYTKRLDLKPVIKEMSEILSEAFDEGNDELLEKVDVLEELISSGDSLIPFTDSMIEYLSNLYEKLMVMDIWLPRMSSLQNKDQFVGDVLNVSLENIGPLLVNSLLDFTRNHLFSSFMNHNVAENDFTNIPQASKLFENLVESRIFSTIFDGHSMLRGPVHLSDLIERFFCFSQFLREIGDTKISLVRLDDLEESWSHQKNITDKIEDFTNTWPYELTDTLLDGRPALSHFLTNLTESLIGVDQMLKAVFEMLNVAGINADKPTSHDIVSTSPNDTDLDLLFFLRDPENCSMGNHHNERNSTIEDCDVFMFKVSKLAEDFAIKLEAIRTESNETTGSILEKLHDVVVSTVDFRNRLKIHLKFTDKYQGNLVYETNPITYPYAYENIEDIKALAKALDIIHRVIGQSIDDFFHNMPILQELVEIGLELLPKILEEIQKFMSSPRKILEIADVVERGLVFCELPLNFIGRYINQLQKHLCDADYAKCLQEFQNLTEPEIYSSSTEELITKIQWSVGNISSLASSSDTPTSFDLKLRSLLQSKLFTANSSRTILWAKMVQPLVSLSWKPHVDGLRARNLLQKMHKFLKWTDIYLTVALKGHIWENLRTNYASKPIVLKMFGLIEDLPEIVKEVLDFYIQEPQLLYELTQNWSPDAICVVLNSTEDLSHFSKFQNSISFFCNDDVLSSLHDQLNPASFPVINDFKIEPDAAILGELMENVAGKLEILIQKPPKLRELQIPDWMEHYRWKTALDSLEHLMKRDFDEILTLGLGVSHIESDKSSLLIPGIFFLMDYENVSSQSNIDNFDDVKNLFHNVTDKVITLADSFWTVYLEKVFGLFTQTGGTGWILEAAMNRLYRQDEFHHLAELISVISNMDNSTWELDVIRYVIQNSNRRRNIGAEGILKLDWGKLAEVFDCSQDPVCFETESKLGFLESHLLISTIIQEKNYQMQLRIFFQQLEMQKDSLEALRKLVPQAFQIHLTDMPSGESFFLNILPETVNGKLVLDEVLKSLLSLSELLDFYHVENNWENPVCADLTEKEEFLMQTLITRIDWLLSLPFYRIHGSELEEKAKKLSEATESLMKLKKKIRSTETSPATEVFSESFLEEKIEHKHWKKIMEKETISKWKEAQKSLINVNEDFLALVEFIKLQMITIRDGNSCSNVSTTSHSSLIDTVDEKIHRRLGVLNCSESTVKHKDWNVYLSPSSRFTKNLIKQIKRTSSRSIKTSEMSKIIAALQKYSITDNMELILKLRYPDWRWKILQEELSGITKLLESADSINSFYEDLPFLHYAYNAIDEASAQIRNCYDPQNYETQKHSSRLEKPFDHTSSEHLKVIFDDDEESYTMVMPRDRLRNNKFDQKELMTLMNIMTTVDEAIDQKHKHFGRQILPQLSSKMKRDTSQEFTSKIDYVTMKYECDNFIRFYEELSDSPILCPLVSFVVCVSMAGFWLQILSYQWQKFHSEAQMSLVMERFLILSLGVMVSSIIALIGFLILTSVISFIRTSCSSVWTLSLLVNLCVACLCYCAKFCFVEKRHMFLFICILLLSSTIADIWAFSFNIKDIYKLGPMLASPSTLLSIGLRIIGSSEAKLIGVSFTNWSHVHSRHYPNTMSSVLTLLFVTSIGWFLLGLIFTFLKRRGSFCSKENPVKRLNSHNQNDNSNHETFNQRVFESLEQPFAGVRVVEIPSIINGSTIDGEKPPSISFQAFENHIFVVYGRSASDGKIICDMLTGARRPQTGNIFSYQTDIYNRNVYVGKMIEMNDIPDFMTVQEALKYLYLLRNRTSLAIASKNIHSVLRSCMVGDLAGKKVCHLQWDEKKIFQVIAAFIGGQRYIVLENPTAGVLLTTKQKIWNIIMKHKCNRTIVVITDRLLEVELLADDLAICTKGCLIWAGPRKSLLEDTLITITFSTKYITGDEIRTLENRLRFDLVEHFPNSFSLHCTVGETIVMILHSEVQRHPEKLKEFILCLEGRTKDIRTSNIDLDFPTLEGTVENLEAEFISKQLPIILNQKQDNNMWRDFKAFKQNTFCCFNSVFYFFVMRFLNSFREISIWRIMWGLAFLFLAVLSLWIADSDGELPIASLKNLPFNELAWKIPSDPSWAHVKESIERQVLETAGRPCSHSDLESLRDWNAFECKHKEIIFPEETINTCQCSGKQCFLDWKINSVSSLLVPFRADTLRRISSSVLSNTSVNILSNENLPVPTQIFGSSFLNKKNSRNFRLKEIQLGGPVVSNWSIETSILLFSVFLVSSLSFFILKSIVITLNMRENKAAVTFDSWGISRLCNDWINYFYSILVIFVASSFVSGFVFVSSYAYVHWLLDFLLLPPALFFYGTSCMGLLYLFNIWISIENSCLVIGSSIVLGAIAFLMKLMEREGVSIFIDYLFSGLPFYSFTRLIFKVLYFEVELSAPSTTFAFDQIPALCILFAWSCLPIAVIIGQKVYMLIMNILDNENDRKFGPSTNDFMTIVLDLMKTLSRKNIDKEAMLAQSEILAVISEEDAVQETFRKLSFKAVQKLSRELNLKIGVCAADGHFHRSLTVEQDLKIQSAVFGNSCSSMNQTVEHCLLSYQLYSEKSKKLKDLSISSLFLLSLAKSMLANPDVLLIEEPPRNTTNEETTKLLKRFLLWTKQNKIMVIFVGGVHWKIPPFVDDVILVHRDRPIYFSSITSLINRCNKFSLLSMRFLSLADSASCNSVQLNQDDEAIKVQLLKHILVEMEPEPLSSLVTSVSQVFQKVQINYTVNQNSPSKFLFHLLLSQNLGERSINQKGKAVKEIQQSPRLGRNGAYSGRRGSFYDNIDSGPAYDFSWGSRLNLRIRHPSGNSKLTPCSTPQPPKSYNSSQSLNRQISGELNFIPDIHGSSLSLPKHDKSKSLSNVDFNSICAKPRGPLSLLYAQDRKQEDSKDLEDTTTF